MSQRALKICFVSVHGYPVINPQAEGTFGGIETRSWCFAKKIARLPQTEVTYVVAHRSAPRHSIVDNVNVVESTRWNEWFHNDISMARLAWRKTGRIPWIELPVLGLKLLAWAAVRPFYGPNSLRWLRPSSYLTEMDADIYVAFGVNAQSDWAFISAQSIGRPFVCCLASGTDLDQRFRDQPDFVNQYGVRSSNARNLIGHSEGIVAQNSSQQLQLKQIWNRESTRINNPLDLAQWDLDKRNPLPMEIPREPYVLWVGRADQMPKRPLKMLETVQANPEIRFVMVLNPGDSEVEKIVHESSLRNLTVLSQLPFQQMPSLMSSACAFATTSVASFEGQPNVLLQAAASSIPIISLETSSEWLEASGAGVCLHGDFEGFNRAIARFFDRRDSVEIRQYGEAGRSYVAREHDSVRQAAKLFNYLQEVATSHSPTVVQLPREVKAGLDAERR